MPKITALTQQNGSHITQKQKSHRNHELEKLKLILSEAFDQNDTLRNKISILEALLVESNHQRQLAERRVMDLERELDIRGRNNMRNFDEGADQRSRRSASF